MTKCPHCQAENRIGAKYCKDCAKPLPPSPKATIPLNDLDQTNNHGSDQPEVERGATRPLPLEGAISQRPNGAIFVDQFQYKSLVYSDDAQIRYLVSQLDVDPKQRYRLCANLDCGAYFNPAGNDPDTYCTDCGSALQVLERDIVLIETLNPPPENLVALAAKNLTHGGVRAPLAVFEENLEGGVRYCMVLPQVTPLEAHPDSTQAFQWAVDLAYGLDYLHDNGIEFGGGIDQDCFALEGQRVVWANFTCDHLALKDTVTDRREDVRSLALVVYRWLTGQNEFEVNPNLVTPQNQVFETALTDPGYQNALEFARALEGALEQMVAPSAVDYRLGRRTHVGMARTLNEDSMLTLELNRNQQSISQPLGLYIVADGMGGHMGGEIASGTIVTSMSDQALTGLLPTKLTQEAGKNRLEWLRDAVQDANSEVYDLRKSAETDMGSTLVAAVLEGDQAYIAHVGDSRAYVINSNSIHQITTDHSLVERLISTNQITREEARFHPQRNVIYRTVGDKRKVDVEVSTHTLKIGEYLLLCSDGLTGMVEDHVIQRTVQEADTPQAACDQLIDAANAAGGDDNITAVIIQIIPA
jgi:protein phosphatase